MKEFERITNHNTAMEDEVYKILIEDEIEFCISTGDDRNIQNYTLSLSKSEYENFLGTVLADFWNDDGIWESICSGIRDIIHRNIGNN